jgi:pyruvate dehydrogenase E1 component
LSPDQEERCPGNLEIEERLRAYMRWNAMAMVVKANRHHPEDGGDLGGHIGSFASLAHMFGAGFNHFWHAESEGHGGDCIYIQGHVAPGVYARAFLEGRLTEEQLLHFRQETGGKGLSSYPHPKLMPELLAVPHRVDGSGSIDGDLPGAVLQVPARPWYCRHQPIARSGCSVVTARWTSPKAWAPSAWPTREKLDNLIFVVNCNLQRLDGPGARQRQGDAGVGGRLSRRRLECDQIGVGP